MDTHNASADVSTSTLNSPGFLTEKPVNRSGEDTDTSELTINHDQTNLSIHVADTETKAEETVPDQTSQDYTEEWRFTQRAQLVFATLATLALMATLDGTSISVALPVCFLS